MIQICKNDLLIFDRTLPFTMKKNKKALDLLTMQSEHMCSKQEVHCYCDLSISRALLHRHHYLPMMHIQLTTWSLITLVTCTVKVSSRFATVQCCTWESGNCTSPCTLFQLCERYTNSTLLGNRVLQWAIPNFPCRNAHAKYEAN